MTPVFTDDVDLMRLPERLLSEEDVVRTPYLDLASATTYPYKYSHRDDPRWPVFVHHASRFPVWSFDATSRTRTPHFLVTADQTTVSATWFKPTISGLGALLGLSPETHGDRGIPSDLRQVQNALAFLMLALPADAAPPSLSPLNDGGIQAEWHRGGLDVEIVFSGDEEERGIYVRNKETGAETELPLDARAFGDAVGDRLALAA